jgi:glutamate N-acetyltransferase/amino-acid N-acetyltransferase
MTGVTAAAGFRASGISAGIRRPGALDLALLVSDRTASAAAVFTRNLVQAAPVTYSRRALEKSGGRARAVITNSGNANACTGKAGDEAARRTAERTAALLEFPGEQVLVASTGVIGVPLPVERLEAALPTAVENLSRQGGASAAQAILTTDTCIKESVRTVQLARGGFTVGGMAKGSGMIHPDMATTLAFITSDAAIDPSPLREILRRATDQSFNRITVDGDTSTNDMLAVLANGASGVTLESDTDLERFETAVTEVASDLARAVARDGEGATKLITVRVTGARSTADALAVARTVASSPLVKTAVHGGDANWGRIVAAAGRAGIALEPARLGVKINDLDVLEPGFGSRFSESEAAEALAGTDVLLTIDLGDGQAEETVWTCDLTADYISINAHYRT